MRPHHLTILLFFVLSASFIPMSADAQTPAKELQKYPAAALKKDFLLLRETLQKEHPGLYRYRSKEAMDALLDSCYRSIRDSMTLLEFYRLTCVAISAIGDGHAECQPPQGSLRDLKKHNRMFPLRLWFTEDKAYVLCEKNGLSAGTEIVSIDRRPIGEITSRIFDCYTGDGVIRTNKRHRVNDIVGEFNMLYRLWTNARFYCGIPEYRG